MTSGLRRLAPEPAAATTVREAYDVERPRPAERPWVAVCMVASLDGAVAVEGASGGLGNDHDREVLLTMRDLADVVIVGAGTVRAEGYGPPRRQGQRIGVVTNSGNIDPASTLFTSGAGFVITHAAATLPDPGIDVVRAGTEVVDLRSALGRLGTIAHGVGVVCAEGGPALNGSLLDAGLVDELALTVSPHLAGGDAPRLIAGAGPRLDRYRLAHLLTDDDGFLFTRWVRG